MYKVYLINFSRQLGEYATFNSAYEAGVKACFEFSVYKGTTYLGHWSPISGWRGGYELEGLTG